MSRPRICVVRAPGTNCDIETAFAFESCGGEAERVHVFRLLENPATLSDYQVLCVPGGFSYGDDLGAGVIFSRQLRGRLGGALADFLQRDRLVLGICNGFQVLLKAGLLPGGAESWPPQFDGRPEATLTWNDNGRYTDRWVRLRVAAGKNVFLRGIDALDLPIAHAEGRLVARDDSTVPAWRERGQVALEYDPHNPNGSVANIAGLGDPSGRILGLMPHPERFLFATQHPQWTRLRLEGDGAGRRLFQNAVEYFR
ncbi:MAG TPA: phosphoribosylformylglycinamidine synthase subunit PurQ [Planctomycetaceae bacterium]|nr:phosphoribosylformylglycinamidine synthase subunit PurQ [Planctomycetaceae bacterium]